MESITGKAVRAAFPSLALLALTAACSSGGGRLADSDSVAFVVDDSFHADNDIAMAVSSLADAISVEEPLDTIDYNYTAVLTDGQGTMLYTDVAGNPGVWEVKVLGPAYAQIQSLSPGDVAAEAIRDYLLVAEEMEPVVQPDSLLAPRDIYSLGGAKVEFLKIINMDGDGMPHIGLRMDISK